MEMKKLLEGSLSQIVSDLVGVDINVEVSISSDLAKGDFTTNIALRYGKKLGNPIELGEKIVEGITKKDIYKRFKKIELVAPGFVNFFLSDEEIDASLNSLMYLDRDKKDGQKILFEFGDPNPFKEPHIGHLRNFILGDTLIHLFESQGDEVIRASYQGDVGLHVAKTLWGLMSSKLKVESLKLDDGLLEDKVKLLGKAYQEGARAYEEDAKEEIDALNLKIYSAVEDEGKSDPEIYSLWQKGRQISLDHFEDLYKTLGFKYDKYYFEKEVAVKGRMIVEENTPKVFIKDDGAIIYKGEEDATASGDKALHTRVFLNSKGAPTYEAKDLALAVQKDKDFPDVDRSIIMTANEQVDYFKVVLKALEKVDKDLAEKTSHLSFGFVNLRDGKMSSRKGKVVGANWLIDEVRVSIKENYKEVEEGVLGEITLGAIKWSMLKFSRESDISFSIDESIDLTGNSGPYMQYTRARIVSILEKSLFKDFEANSVKNIPPELLALGRKLCQFEMQKKQASESMQPNILTEYLFSLAQNINSIYEKERIIGHVNEKEILTLMRVSEKVIEDGLRLLGISSPKKI